MLEMSQINYIKRLREIEGCFILEISRRLKIDWRIAKKYADENVSVQPRAKRNRESPVMGPYMHIIEC